MIEVLCAIIIMFLAVISVLHIIFFVAVLQPYGYDLSKPLPKKGLGLLFFIPIFGMLVLLIGIAVMRFKEDYE